jgi:hypothetical protein
VVSAAVEHSHHDRAEVIRAIDPTIGNPKSDEDQARRYRVRVTVNRYDDGEMKVTGWTSPMTAPDSDLGATREITA